MTATIEEQSGFAVATQNKFEVEHVYFYKGGHRMHYQVAGPLDGPPLVLLHGIGGSVNWWQENLPSLSRHFRTYALDLPGFGRSWRLSGPVSIDRLADFVRDWLHHLGLERVHLLGHSMGGQIAARLTARHPHLVEKLVLVAPSGLWLSVQEHLNWSRQMPKVRVPLRQVLTIATGTMKTDLLALGMSLRAILADRQAAESLKALVRPTLMLWGTADAVLSPQLAPRALALLEQAPARLEYIELGTHDLMFDQAARFNEVVVEFLREVS